MTKPHDTFSPHRGFYPSVVSEKQRKEALAQVLRERKEKHDADEEIRERLYTERHAARVHHFCTQIAQDDRFTDEEKQNLIKASWDW